MAQSATRGVVYAVWGEKAEEGTHQVLLKMRGLYYRLYQLQYEREELKVTNHADSKVIA